jgi:hypothetical protein
VVVRGAHFLPNHAGAKLLAFAGSTAAWPRRPVALMPVAAGHPRARHLTRSSRRVPRAGLIGGADLAVGGPRRCAAAQEAAGLAQPPQGISLPDDRSLSAASGQAQVRRLRRCRRTREPIATTQIQIRQ